jgi:hypothetical protein
VHQASAACGERGAACARVPTTVFHDERAQEMNELRLFDDRMDVDPFEGGAPA